MNAYPQHIPQPPHSAGEAYKGLRARIEANQIPSPTDAIEADREQWEGQTFMTLPGNHPPLSSTSYIAFDQGNSSPKYVRVSTWNIPSTSQLAKDCQIPLSAIFQPFADRDLQEEVVPLVEFEGVDPARCDGCRGYINPWCVWTAGGKKWKCNLCGHETEVSPLYFCNLDANLLRTDHSQRPELNKGTVDFAVSENYWASPLPARLSPSYFTEEPPLHVQRKPEPMDFVFALDVSVEAVQSGFLQTACSSLRDILFGELAENGSEYPSYFPKGCRIAILTFDRTVHFYNLFSDLARASMLVLSDLEEIFLPLREGLFVDPIGFRTVIEDLLSSLPSRYDDTVVREAALGSTLIAGLAALAGRGGNIVMFLSTLPTVGPGSLEPLLDESKSYGTDKEKLLFVPRNATWRSLAEECAEEGIGVSMFLGMSKPIDVGSIGVVPNITGGDLFFHPRFDRVRDRIVLASQLQRLLTRTTVYNCTMRIRCSAGLRISKHYGHFYQNSVTDLTMGVMDSDKAVSILLEHSGTLDDRQYAHLQCAVLYTTITGQRRVRTCNLALQVASLAGTVFRSADIDAVVCHFAHEAMSNLAVQRLDQIRESLTEKCSSILLGYRRNCAAATAPSQLILPEAFKALPVYTLAIIKSKPLKGRNVSADVRNYHAHRLSSTGVRGVMCHLYPRLLAIHDLDDKVALPDPTTGHMTLPSLMRASHLHMEAHGVYLIDNEEFMIFWVGTSVSPQLLQDLFGVDDIVNLNPRLMQLPALETRLSVQVRNILAHRYEQRGRTPKMMIARQNMDGIEIEFSDMLVEDQNNAAMSYLDYLCLVHKQINTALTNGGSISGGPASLRSSIW